MTQDILRRALWFVILVVVQAIVLGRIHLFNCATPLFYVYFVTMFPRSYPKWSILLAAFFMGLFIDMFSNTPGVASASLTLIAAIQPYYFQLFVPNESPENMEPGLYTMGPTRYHYYVIPLVLFYCLVFFSLELFNFFNLLEWFKCVCGSTVITLVMIYAFEIAKRK